MRCLVFGGRDFRDKEHLWAKLDEIHAVTPITELIHGDASGADTLGGQWGIARHVKVTAFPALWGGIHLPGAVIKYRRDGKPYNAKAGFDRNQKMADYGPDLAVMAPGGNGTRDMRSRLKCEVLEIG